MGKKTSSFNEKGIIKWMFIDLNEPCQENIYYVNWRGAHENYTSLFNEFQKQFLKKMFVPLLYIFFGRDAFIIHDYI